MSHLNRLFRLRTLPQTQPLTSSQPENLASELLLTSIGDIGILTVVALLLPLLAHG